MPSPTGFFPAEADMLGKDGRASKLYRDFFRRTSNSNAVVLTGEETTIETVGDVIGVEVTGDTLRCTNATLLSIHGIQPGSSGLGHSIPVAALGAGVVEIHNQSAVDPVPLNRIDTGSGVTLRLAPGRGRAWLEYDSTTQRHRVLVYEQGAPLEDVFSALNYTAASGAWTVSAGNLQAFKYVLRGKLLTVMFDIRNTTVTVSPAYLEAVIPGGYTAVGPTSTLCQLTDAGSLTTGVVAVSNGGTKLRFTRLDGASITAGVAQTSMAGELTFEVG